MNHSVEMTVRIQYVSGVHAIADGIWLIPHRKASYASIALRNDLYAVRDGERLSAVCIYTN